MTDELDPDGGFSGPISEAVHKIAEDAAEATLSGQDWDEKKVEVWVDSIAETCMGGLVGLGLPYKWTVTVTVLQKYPKTMSVASSVSWANASDGAETVLWPPIKRKDTWAMTVMAVVQVFAV